MTQETINKLKECKELYDQGILNQEEFETEKAKILNARPTAEVETPQEVVHTPVAKVSYDYNGRPSSRGVKKVPWYERQAVMKANSAEEAASYYKRKYILSIFFTMVGAYLLFAFFRNCDVGGFWTIFLAVFWALIPGCTIFFSGIYSAIHNKRMKDQFEGMTDEELDLLKDYIEGRRAYEMGKIVQGFNAAGEAVNGAAKTYKQMTGRNAWMDLGSWLGKKM